MQHFVTKNAQNTESQNMKFYVFFALVFAITLTITQFSGLSAKKDKKDKKAGSALLDRCIYPICSKDRLTAYDKDVQLTFNTFKPALSAFISKHLIYAHEIKYLQQAWSFTYRNIRRPNDVGYLYHFDLLVNPNVLQGMGRADEVNRYCFCKSMITTTNGTTPDKAKVEYVDCENCFFDQKPASKK